MQLEVVKLGSIAGQQPPCYGADLHVAVAVGAGAEDAHEIFGVGEESFHPQALAAPAAIRLVCAGTDGNPSSLVPTSPACGPGAGEERHGSVS